LNGCRGISARSPVGVVSHVIAADPRALPAPWFEVAVVPAREEVWLRAIGELDLAAAPRLSLAVDDLIAVGFDQVIIDLRRLTFIDASGVRLLLDLAQRSDADGWRLALVGGGEQVRRMLALTGALGRLPYRDTGTDRPNV
jgi:anti-anti-sigma factor